MLLANVCRSGIALFSRGQTSKVAMRFVHKPNVQSSIKRRQVSKQTRTIVSKSPTATPSTSLKELVVESVSKSRPTAHSRSLKEIFMASAGQRGMVILQTKTPFKIFLFNCQSIFNFSFQCWKRSCPWSRNTWLGCTSILWTG